MPLDNAQFIAEFDTASPAGTDPINQGDDHLRQIKIATQQSFPNVGSAVPQTGVQMAQMAIKNEVNTFTAQNVFDDIATFNSTARFNFIAENIGTAFRSVALAATNNAGILWIGDSATLRWDFIRAATNTSGDLQIDRYDGNGTFQDVPFRIAQASGRYTFERVGFHKGGADILDETGAQQIALSFSDPTNSWSMLNENTAFEGLPASTFRMRRFINGAPTTDAFRVDNATGTFTHKSELILDTGTNNRLKFETNGAQYWEILHVGGSSHNFEIRRFINDVLFDAPFQIKNATGQIVTPSLPTGPGTLPTGTLYAKQSQSFAPTELVLGVAP